MGARLWQGIARLQIEIVVWEGLLTGPHRVAHKTWPRLLTRLGRGSQRWKPTSVLKLPVLWGFGLVLFWSSVFRAEIELGILCIFSPI